MPWKRQCKLLITLLQGIENKLFQNQKVVVVDLLATNPCFSDIKELPKIWVNFSFQPYGTMDNLFFFSLDINLE